MSDCSPANRERELGLDRRETGLFYPTDELGAATVIEVSSRGVDTRVFTDVRECVFKDVQGVVCHITTGTHIRTHTPYTDNILKILRRIEGQHIQNLDSFWRNY